MRAAATSRPRLPERTHIHVRTIYIYTYTRRTCARARVQTGGQAGMAVRQAGRQAGERADGRMDGPGRGADAYAAQARTNTHASAVREHARNSPPRRAASTELAERGSDAHAAARARALIHPCTYIYGRTHRRARERVRNNARWWQRTKAPRRGY